MQIAWMFAVLTFGLSQMGWPLAWRRYVAKLFILLALATALITLALFAWQRDLDLQSLNRIAAELTSFVSELPPAQGDAELANRLRAWANDRGVHVACLATDGSLVAQSHADNLLTQALGSFNVATLQPNTMVVLKNYPVDQNWSGTIVAQRLPGSSRPENQNEITSQIALVGIGWQSRTGTGLRQILPIWWMALTAFLVTAGYWFVLERRFEATKHEFARAARRIAAGRFQEPAPSISRDLPWRSLSEAFAQMESSLANRDRLVQDEKLRIQSVLSSMVEGVIAIDADQRIVLANHSAMTMLSLHPEFLIGRFSDEVVRNPSFEEAINRARATGQAVEIEFETVGPRRRAISMRVAPLSHDQPKDLAAVLYDVTDLRRLETVRRDFVANVSHELKTPLAAIKAYAETLRMGAIDDKENNLRFLEQIEIHTELLERQVRDLLHLARVESGRAAFEMSVIDADQSCQDCATRFQEEAARREIRLSCEKNSDPVLAIADREAVATILDNLVSNAIRYSRPGGWVRIAATTEGNLAVLTVADNGIGIAPEHQSRVFERFYRVDKARSRDVGGTGLGLAIVKHTVQALEGQIELTSSIGRGSTFRVLLHKA